MPIKTTCIGAYPKPDFISDHTSLSAWSEADNQDSSTSTARAGSYVTTLPDADSRELFDRATRAAIADQVACGIDIPTDGEQRRENYVHYHCRYFDGIDFDNPTSRVYRNGAAVADLPTITGKITPKREHFLDLDFVAAQAFTEQPVKITVPGPITIMDTTANVFYQDPRHLAFDLSAALNFEIRALADAGCKFIQVDEPLFARNIDAALDYGVECLERCFDGLPGDVKRIVHICCGYPGHLDDADYQKADPDTYLQLARPLDDSCVDQISLEDAHRHISLDLLESFTRSTVILGCVAIADSRVETVAEITQRLRAALQHIDTERLLAAPDCGLILLGRELSMQKMRNMVQAAQAI